ncbi:MAG TPA: BTAD domain-containing putative transcriptional regulator [Candidatus Kapabacteria bacterium]|nr:BTAD domain-containing putative transcriptional regulator [Candidatus Kapabacteria bacterium]
MTSHPIDHRTGCGAAAAGLITAATARLRPDPLAALPVATDASAQARAAGSQPLLAEALFLVASSLNSLGRFPEVFAPARECLRLAQDLDIGWLRVRAQCLIGVALRSTGEIPAAIEAYAVALADARGIRSLALESLVLQRLTILYAVTGNYVRALHLARRSLKLARRSGDRLRIGDALRGMALVHTHLGHDTAAFDYCRQARSIALDIGDRYLFSMVEALMAELLVRSGDLEKAAVRTASITRWATETGSVLFEITGWLVGAMIRMRRGDVVGAFEMQLHGCEIAARAGERIGMFEALSAMSDLLIGLGDGARAMECTRIAERLCMEFGGERGWMLHRLARCHIVAGRIASGAVLGRAALQRSLDSRDPYLQRASLFDIAMAAALAGQHADACEALNASIAIGQHLDSSEGMIVPPISFPPLGDSSFACDTGTADACRQYVARAVTFAINTGSAGALCDAFSAARSVVPGMGSSDLDAFVAQLSARCGDRISGERARLQQLRAEVDRQCVLIEGRALRLDEREIAKAVRIVNASADTAVADAAFPAAAVVGNVATDGHGDRDAVIRVWTFGDLRVWQGEREIDRAMWGRRRARDLFAFLLTRYRRRVSLDEIVEALWEEDEADVRATLVMNAVAHLRRVLEPERGPHSESRVLRGMNRTYTLDLGEGAWIDVVEFRELIARARRCSGARASALYQKAVALYGDDYLSSYRSAAWSSSERELLRDFFLDAMEFLAHDYAANGAVNEALLTARRMLDHDPVNEAGCEIACSLLMKRGRAAEAATLFDRYRSAFHRMYGTEPPSDLKCMVRSSSGK